MNYSEITIKEALNFAQQRFETISDTSRLDAECLLSFALQKPSVYLRTWPDNKLDQSENKHFLNLVQRREQGEPIAYIVESKEFWSLELRVSKNTLIPRPETETLVEQVIRIANQQKLDSILDLGTGSGAIAIAISSELQKMKQHPKIIATDVSSQALQIAMENAATYAQPVEFVESDWFSNITPQKFDLIVSNPPYIEQEDVHLTQGDVRFEPITALVSGRDGLSDIRVIVEQAQPWLQPNGWLVFEHGYYQAEAVSQLFEDYGYENIQTIKDLAQNDRITFALKP